MTRKLLLLFIILLLPGSIQAETFSYPRINARSACVMECASGKVLWQKNPGLIIPPASLTKILTLFVIGRAVKKGELNWQNKIPIPPEAFQQEYGLYDSIIGLGPDITISLEELCQALIIYSANDAARTLAIHYAGSEKQFCLKMNELCQELKLKYCYFEDTAGLSERNQVTALEMALLCRAYLEEFPDFPKRFHSKPYFYYPQAKHLPPGDNRIVRKFFNRNSLLKADSAVQGLKTGFIYESGFNLALSLNIEGIHIISIQLGGPYTYYDEGKQKRDTDGRQIINWLKKNFKAARIHQKQALNIKINHTIYASCPIRLESPQDFLLPRNFSSYSFSLKKRQENFYLLFQIDKQIWQKYKLKIDYPPNSSRTQFTDDYLSPSWKENKVDLEEVFELELHEKLFDP